MKRLLIAGGFLLGFTLVAAPAHAQTGTARGRVLDEQGQPLVEAKVVLEYLGGVTRKYETKTSKKGEFTQVGMYPGPYKITVTKEGFQGTFAEERITLGDPTQIADFKLKSMAAAQKEAGGGTEALKATEVSMTWPAMTSLSAGVELPPPPPAAAAMPAVPTPQLPRKRNRAEHIEEAMAFGQA